jgi:ADP-heptose:LPS heptosyltransferase
MKAGFPDSHITWVVDGRFQDVVRCCSAVDEVVVRDRSHPLQATPGKYEAALDLQGLLKSSLVVARAKAKEKVGYHWQREGSALFSRRVIPDPSSIHVVDQYVDVARAVGGLADRADFALVPDPESVVRTRNRVPDRFVVVNPGSARASKRWSTERFAELVDGLPLPTVLIGAPGETGAEEVSDLCKHKPINLSGQTSVLELIALISLAQAHVGGDTGSSHIAAALGVPAIGLYSATRPERSCPYGQIDRCHFDPEGMDMIKSADVLLTLTEAIP